MRSEKWWHFLLFTSYFLLLTFCFLLPTPCLCRFGWCGRASSFGADVEPVAEEHDRAADEDEEVKPFVVEEEANEGDEGEAQEIHRNNDSGIG